MATINDSEWRETVGEAEVREWKADTWDEKPKWMTERQDDERQDDDGENDSDEKQSEHLNASGNQQASNKEAEKKQKMPFQC